MLTRESLCRVKTSALDSDSPCPLPRLSWGRPAEKPSCGSDPCWYQTSACPGNDARPAWWVCTLQHLVIGGGRERANPDDLT